jgi:hypothetical protein
MDECYVKVEFAKKPELRRLRVRRRRRDTACTCDQAYE